MKSPPLDPQQLKVYPLAQRESLTRVEEILVTPESPPPNLTANVANQVRQCAQTMRNARQCGAGRILFYGAHLLRNGAALIVEQLLARGWLTHLATNGAGTIHDWEFAWLGRSTENVATNVATGRFGAWEEPGRYIHLALLAGGLRGEGYGGALGRFIVEDGVTLPTRQELTNSLRAEPAHPLASARADLLQMMCVHELPGGRIPVAHRWKQASILGHAFRHDVALTVHPGIGYDIIANHPMFSGAVIGRAATHDFHLLGGSLGTLDNGVVLSIGSAIMGPQVFEKSLSCVNNLRMQTGQPVLSGHEIFVVDLQDGRNWDWSQGEPPKHHPAYYLRFCKSYSRMGGTMHYAQCDNVAFLHNLYHQLLSL